MTKIIVLLIVFTAFNSQVSARSLDEQIEVDLITAKALKNREDIVKKMNSLLRNQLGATREEVDQINAKNSPRFEKLAEYRVRIDKLKTLILEEVFNRNPNKKRLNKIYKKFEVTKTRREDTWNKIQESIWNIIGVKGKKASKHSFADMHY